MICPKCGSENVDESSFCNKCGGKLLGDKEYFKNLIKYKMKLFNNKRNIIISCIILVLIISALAGVTYFTNPVSKFKSDIRNNKQSEAITLYNSKIKGNTSKENSINTYLRNEASAIVDSFKNEKIEFNKANNALQTIKSIGLISSDVDSAINKVNNLNDSRIAFKKADEFLKNNDLINAINEYKNVIPDDKNYEKAKEQISNNEKKYKDQVLKNADDLANSKDFEKAMATLSEAMSVFPNDVDLTAKNEAYKKMNQEKLDAEKNQKIEDAKNKQELTVVSASVVPDYFRINDEAKVIIKNNTNKVVKTFTVGILMYDENGYPLKSGILAGGDQLFNGKAESVNIQPGQAFGDNSTWNLYTNYGTVKKIIACVIDVEYYDGSKWTNDYYNYWKDEYLGKPYK